MSAAMQGYDMLKCHKTPTQRPEAHMLVPQIYQNTNYSSSIVVVYISRQKKSGKFKLQPTLNSKKPYSIKLWKLLGDMQIMLILYCFSTQIFIGKRYATLKI